MDNLTVTTAKCRNGKWKNIGGREGLGDPFSCGDVFSETLVSFSLMKDNLCVESISVDEVRAKVMIFGTVSVGGEVSGVGLSQTWAR